ncbi:MAG: hypothetical protein VW378_03815 [bacterium]
MGEPPQRIENKFKKKDTVKNKQLFKKKDKDTSTEKKISSKQPISSNTISQNNSSSTVKDSKILLPPNIKQTSYNVTSEESIESIRKKLNLSIQRRQFERIKKLLEKMPKSIWNNKEKNIEKELLLFEEIENEEKRFNNQFKKDTNTNQKLTNKINFLYTEAKGKILEGNNNISKDLLIHILFLDKSHFKARKLLNKGLKLQANDYIVENIELKYWRESEINYYSGNYKKAIENLNALTIFESNNATIYERLGSNYYNISLINEAINSWTIAMGLDPSKNHLKKVIEKAKNYQKEQEKELKNFQQTNEESNKKESLPDIEETQLLSVFYNRADAFKYKNKLQKENPKRTLYLYNKNDGSIEVRIKKIKNRSN